MYGVDGTMNGACNPMYGVDDTANHNLLSGFESLSLECGYFCLLSGLAVNFFFFQSG